MRLVTFREGTEERLGFLLDDRILDPRRTADHAGRAGLCQRARVHPRRGSGPAGGEATDRQCTGERPGPAVEGHAHRADAAVDAAVQRQQLPRSQQGEGQHPDQRQGAGVLREDRGQRGRPRRAHHLRPRADQEARLRDRAGHRHRQAGPAYPGRVGARSRVRLHHRQRRDRARPPGPEVPRRKRVVRPRPRQIVRHQRPARAVHRHGGRDPRSARTSSSRPASTAICGNRAAPRK